MNRSTPGLPVHHHLPEFTQTQCASSQWCHPAISSSVIPFSSCPQSLPASESSNESTLCMRWPKYWGFSFSIIPSKVIPGLISFRMDWLDLLAVQGTLKSLLQHHSSKASILQVLHFLHSPTLSNSMKLSHALWAHLGWAWWRGLTECGPLEYGKPLQYSCLENPMNSMNSMHIFKLWGFFNGISFKIFPVFYCVIEAFLCFTSQY